MLPNHARSHRLTLCSAGSARQGREIVFVEDHGIRRDQFLTLQTVDHEAGRLLVVERRKLIEDGVEPLDRAAIVILVMADEDFLRQAFDFLWIERQGVSVCRSWMGSLMGRPSEVFARAPWLSEL